MIELVVEACGPATSLQDAGRFGFQRFGVSPAGAMDLMGLALANALVGNPSAAAAIELAFLGGSFIVSGGPLLLAVAGPGCALSIGRRIVASGHAGRAEPGERVTVGPVRDGVYAYLAVAGGIALRPDMGSLSVHRRSGIGGRPLSSGDRLPCTGDAAAERLLRVLEVQKPPAGPIRVMLGPQDDHFAPEAVATLLSVEYLISSQADRMGCRLEGPRLRHAGGYNIVSDGIVAGHIQVPGEGKPIVLLRDRQTTGGYPKIATVISADLGRFAQIPPGSAVYFRRVTREEAVAAAIEARRAVERLPAVVRPFETAPSVEDLLSLNLIDGVSSAFD